MRIALIGGGVMGEAIIASLLRQGVVQPQDVTVSDISEERRHHLRGAYGVTALADNRQAVQRADLVLLAVKPQEFPAVTQEMRGVLRSPQVAISIMAGVSITSLRQSLGHQAIVRVMPNTPAQIGQGVCAWTATPEVDERARGQVRRILEALGKAVYFPEEKYIDMATAVSASGPGFLFLVMEAMIDGAVHIGLRREVATEMVMQTVLGSARFWEKSGRHPAELRNMVTSPGGTTAAGLQALERAGVRAAIVEAIAAAYQKSKALGG